MGVRDPGEGPSRRILPLSAGRSPEENPVPLPHVPASEAWPSASRGRRPPTCAEQARQAPRRTRPVGGCSRRADRGCRRAERSRPQTSGVIAWASSVHTMAPACLITAQPSRAKLLRPGVRRGFAVRRGAGPAGPPPEPLPVAPPAAGASSAARCFEDGKAPALHRTRPSGLLPIMMRPISSC